MKVAIQGELGSFSHEAAERMLPRCTVVPCSRSAEVFDRVARETVGAAVIPIENTLAGTVAEHADLMLTHEVFIQAEYLLRSAEVFDRVARETVGAAVIPIENTLAGTVAEHADLMLTHEVFIQAEYLLRIVHNVIAMPGVRLG